ncbi:DegV family protein [Staphylococcus massiliensis]|uniref:DegV family protein n=1 Tax=Staphylococcus massiliensis S46 TaxID=1229783 RepID=K9AY60_9STAP|nr:DegV family protein [Staphylococcus massiliensis]EKU47492.1 DegV family protein [Staphylococcus massiliensis S46]MCG3398865.1 DegV family protein [Staphylococcus massiliensis]MCG3401131.1 DegV family protein [Staphylococcus massiliensis]POA00234.1 DegV family protein [Staphylococcus massiliensis CCUG 55927]
MPQKIIVTDSTSDLPKSFIEEHDIKVVPLNITIDGKSYEDQNDITSESYINYLTEGKSDLKTSQPAIGKFLELYDSYANQDVEIISIHLSSSMSGTYQTALQASEMTNTKVTVIDSKSISFGLGFQIQHLVEWVKEGLPTEEIIEKMNHVIKNVKIFVIIGQLNQLIKGGRVSKAKGLIGNLMKIKPICEVIDGKIEMVHNARTYNACMKYIKKELHHFVGNDHIKALGLAHANAEDLVEKFKAQMEETFQVDRVSTNVTTPVISTHTGSGALGVVVLKS